MIHLLGRHPDQPPLPEPEPVDLHAAPTALGEELASIGGFALEHALRRYDGEWRVLRHMWLAEDPDETLITG